MVQPSSFPVILGAVVANLISGSLWLMMGPSRAAWSWECTVYGNKDSTAAVYMQVNATDGPSCSDGSKLTCDCSGNPCTGAVPALPSDLVCAGAGDDAGTDGCFKLHHTYGTKPTALSAVAGQGTGDLGTSCGEAGIVKIIGNSNGLDMLKSWNSVTADKADASGAPASASDCQAKCAAEPACKFFTYNDQGASGGTYDNFRGLCFLHEELSCSGSAYAHYHGAISGPARCTDMSGSTTSGASDPATSGTLGRAVAQSAAFLGAAGLAFASSTFSSGSAA